jgi:hypothetical protein
MTEQNRLLEQNRIELQRQLFNDNMQYKKDRDFAVRENARMSLFNQQLLVQAIGSLAIAFTKTPTDTTMPDIGPRTQTTMPPRDSSAPEASIPPGGSSDELNLEEYPAGHTSTF